MANMTKSTAGLVTTYVITDASAATATIAVTNNPGSGITCTLASSGNFKPDGQQSLTTLMQMVSTGLLP
jgi:hypothetical protein